MLPEESTVSRPPSRLKIWLALLGLLALAVVLVVRLLPPGDVLAGVLSLLVIASVLAALVLKHQAERAMVKRYQAQLDYAAHYDALTGLANRTLLSTRLRAACARARETGKMVGV